MSDGGTRSMQGFWLGGTANEANPDASVRSMLAFWMGGAAMDEGPPPPIGVRVQVVKAVSVGRLMGKN